MPIYEDEYDGEVQVDTADIEEKDKKDKKDAGMVVFSGDRLPWAPGRYELRYHHDGKHNVMSRLAPVDIVGEFSKVARVTVGVRKQD